MIFFFVDIDDKAKFCCVLAHPWAAGKRDFSPSQDIRFVPGRCFWSNTEKRTGYYLHITEHVLLALIQKCFFTEKTPCFISSQLPLCWIRFTTLHRKWTWCGNVPLFITCSDLSVHIVTLRIYTTFLLLEGWGSLVTPLLSRQAGWGPSDAVYFVVIFKWPFQIHLINEIYFNLCCITDWSEELYFCLEGRIFTV